MRKILALVSMLVLTSLPLSDAFAKAHAKGGRKPASHSKQLKHAKAKAKKGKVAKGKQHATYSAKEGHGRKPASVHSKKPAHGKKAKDKKHGRKH
jgi:hypothetical protein